MAGLPQAAATAEAAAATAAATASVWGLGSAIAGASTAGLTMLGGGWPMDLAMDP